MSQGIKSRVPTLKYVGHKGHVGCQCVVYGIVFKWLALNILWERSVSEDSDRFDLTILESELKGKTLLVYWYLLQQPTHTVGIREVQRALGFSSPSIAMHHLGKLQDLQLVEKKNTGEYVLEEEVKVGILRFFTRMGRFLVPRYLFYSVLISTMLAAYVVLCSISGNNPSFYALMFAGAAMVIFWVETLRLWRSKPF